MQLAPLPTKRATFTTCAHGQARCTCRLAIGSPDPSQSQQSTENVRDQLAPAGVFAVGAARRRQCRITALHGQACRCVDEEHTRALSPTEDFAEPSGDPVNRPGEALPVGALRLGPTSVALPPTLPLSLAPDVDRVATAEVVPPDTASEGEESDRMRVVGAPALGMPARCSSIGLTNL
jgi:hypothetical protein